VARGLTVVAALAAVTVAAGCGTGGFTGIYDLPLPGGADLGDHPYQVSAQFQDVLDLVPQAAVKVNDVAVGRVSSISLPANGWTADVTMEINGSVTLPANAVAWLRQSSLLGEKYVELAAPTDGSSTGQLANGATIPLDRTNRNPQVEEVFGALSMLLNGGGIAQLRTISQQLNDALSGNEPQVRSALDSLNTLVSNLDSHKQDITDALDGLDRLSATLAGRDQQIGNVLDNITPGLHVLDQQRSELVTLLNSLDTLSGVAVSTINASKDDLVADLRSLAPTLRELADAGQSLPQALQVLFTYPFTDAVLDDVRGDYLNVYISVSAKPGTTIIPPITPPPPADGTTSSAARGTSVPGTSGAPLPLPSIDGTVTTTPDSGGSSSSAPPSGSGSAGSGSAGSSTPPSSTSPSSTSPSSTQSSTGTSADVRGGA
jgi:phospholipid/cholesterol/gamma-HCH transport system substrate-binding protein